MSAPPSVAGREPHVVVVRVWLPDRPGALGQVASRIGSVRGDLLGIEILEAGGGRVIDELVVALPDAALVDLMVAEVHAIDGVSVEHVRVIPEGHADPGLTALDAAAVLAETLPGGRIDGLVVGLTRVTEADWVLVVLGEAAVASTGAAPTPEWVGSLVSGSRHLGGPRAPSSDLFWADLPRAGGWIAAGRDGRPVHDRERVRFALLARLADALLAEASPV